MSTLSMWQQRIAQERVAKNHGHPTWEYWMFSEYREEYLLELLDVKDTFYDWTVIVVLWIGIAILLFAF